jgi:Gpi18-like mannosyltransferase
VIAQLVANRVTVADPGKVGGFDAARPGRHDDASPPRTSVRGRFASAAVISGILLVGLAFRAWLVSDIALAHKSDMSLFVRWTHALAEKGLGQFYQSQRFCDYPPLSVLMFLGIGRTAALFRDALPRDELFQILLKTTACLADLALAVLILIEARRLLGRGAAITAAALYFLNPVVMYDSAYWGQIDSVFTALLVIGLVCVGRTRWGLAGAAAAAAVLAKFQAIALVPLLAFETYRVGGWTAIGRMLLGATALAAVVLAPFALTDTLDDVLSRSYVNVIGQYNELSKGAYNIWHLVGAPDRPDTTVPAPIVRLVAGGSPAVAADASWLLGLSWRRIALIAFALSVAIVLTLYSLRPQALSRYAAAGLLALAFFLFPTEMHERYAFPALAFLAIWAPSAAWRERAYFALSALLLLNLAAILPADRVSAQIGCGVLLLFIILAAWLIWPRSSGTPEKVENHPERSACSTAGCLTTFPAEEPAPPRLLIRWFRRLTAVATILVVCAGGAIGILAARAPTRTSASEAVWLSELHPRSLQQAWRKPSLDRSVSGAPLHVGQTIYLRGVGTHAPSRLVYDVPEGVTRFRALVGIDRGARGGTSAATVELDGKRVFASPVLTSVSGPVEVDIPVDEARQITLRTDPTSDGQRGDHVDWALARFE